MPPRKMIAWALKPTSKAAGYYSINKTLLVYKRKEQHSRKIQKIQGYSPVKVNEDKYGTASLITIKAQLDLTPIS